MKVSDGIAKFIKSQGVDHVFELSGGMITHLLDSLLKEKINIVAGPHTALQGIARRFVGFPFRAILRGHPGSVNVDVLDHGHLILGRSNRRPRLSGAQEAKTTIDLS